MKIFVDYNRVDRKRYVYDTEVGNVKDMMTGEYLNESQKTYRLIGANDERIRCNRSVLLNFINIKLTKIKLLSEGFVELTQEVMPGCSPNQFIHRDGTFVRVNNKTSEVKVSKDENLVYINYHRSSNYVKRNSVVNLVFGKKEQLISEGFIYLNGFKNVKNDNYLVNELGVIYSLKNKCFMKVIGNNGYNLRCTNITRRYFRINELVKFYEYRMGDGNAYAIL